MKRIVALVMCLMCIFLCAACGEEEEGGTEILSVTGKTYSVDLESINVAWDDGKTPNEIKQNDFISSVKVWYKSSKITFTDENSFTLSNTNNGMYDFVASGCDRIDNELYKEIRLQGKVDVMLYEDKVSFLCDFFVKGWGMLLSIDYNLVK